MKFIYLLMVFKDAMKTYYFVILSVVLLGVIFSTTIEAITSHGKLVLYKDKIKYGPNKGNKYFYVDL